MNAPAQHPPAVRSTCPYCGVGCGVLAKPDGRGGAVIAGDPEHPANFGRLCSKGSALGETLGLAGRLLHPMLRQADGTLARASWDIALGRAVDGFARTVAQHGPGSVAFYLSGQLLTEDYYVANKLMKGFIGSANVDTNSRLCMASSVAGHRRAFGEDTVPGTYEDIDRADLIVLVGSNAAWCHPVLYQRMVASKRARGAMIVVIDPRRTATREEADLFLPSRPAWTWRCSAACWLTSPRRCARLRLYRRHTTSGFERRALRARETRPSASATCDATGLGEVDAARFYDCSRRPTNVVTLYSQGVNQSAAGTDKVNAIINCHLATGRIGRPGMGPFSLTGQPNAMGGREVGGLANQLAAHHGLRTRRYRPGGPLLARAACRARPGLKAVDMFEAVRDGRHQGAVDHRRPIRRVSMPRAGPCAKRSHACPFVVVSDCWPTDTTRLRRMSAAGGGVGRKGRHRHQFRAPHLASAAHSGCRRARRGRIGGCSAKSRAAWAVLGAFDYRSAADIFREHAALSAFENDGRARFRHRRARSSTTMLMRSTGAMAGRGQARRAARTEVIRGRRDSSRQDGKARIIAPDPTAARAAG